jgi:hypothetical protein
MTLSESTVIPGTFSACICKTISGGAGVGVKVMVVVAVAVGLGVIVDVLVGAGG